MVLRDFVAKRRLSITPYKNGVMLIVRAAQPGLPDDRILLNSSKFSDEDKVLIKTGKLEEFVLSRAHYTVTRAESGDFFYLVPPTRITDINPDWSQSGNPDQGQKPWWENLFDDDDEGEEIPF